MDSVVLLPLPIALANDVRMPLNERQCISAQNESVVTRINVIEGGAAVRLYPHDAEPGALH